MLSLGPVRRVSLNLGRLERSEAHRLKYTAPSFEQVLTVPSVKNPLKTFRTKDKIHVSKYFR